MRGRREGISLADLRETGGSRATRTAPGRAADARMTTRRAGGSAQKPSRASRGSAPREAVRASPNPQGTTRSRERSPPAKRARASRPRDPGAHPDDHPNHPRFWVAGGAGRVLARPMLDSSPSLDDPAALRAALRRDGYLLLRGVLPPRDVRRARRRCLDALAASRPDCFHPDARRRREGILAPDATRLSLLSRQDIATSPEVRAVVESNALFDLVEALFDGARAMTTRFKWLRAVAGGEYTGPHADRVFLGRGCDRLVTAWIPLGVVRVEDGALLVARGSHANAAFTRVRETYGASEVGEDGTRSGWLANDAAAVAGMLGEGAEVDWRTTRFEPGDVAVLGIDTVHMSASNASGEEGGDARLRVSCDTRWQPAAAKADDRVREWRRRDDEGRVETVVVRDGGDEDEARKRGDVTIRD